MTAAGRAQDPSVARRVISAVLCALLAVYLVPTGALAQETAGNSEDAPADVPATVTGDEEIEYFDTASNEDEPGDGGPQTLEDPSSDVVAADGAQVQTEDPDAAEDVEASDASTEEEHTILTSLPTEEGVVTIKAGGEYTLAEGAVGEIVIATAEPVRIIGTGCALAEDGSITSQSTPVWINATGASAANLTLKDMYLYVDAEMRSEAAPYAGHNVIDFAGMGNRLQIEGTVAIDYDIPDATAAAIHVPPTAELALVGDGTLYLSAKGAGAALGGNADEVNGAVTVGDYNDPALSVFAKGSGSAAIIGQGAQLTDDGAAAGEIALVGGSVNLVSNGEGTALGGPSDAAANIRVKQHAQVAVNLEATGAACAGCRQPGSHGSSGSE